MRKGIKSGLLFCVLCPAVFLGSCNSPAKENVATIDAVDADALTIVANVTVYPEFLDEVLPAIEAVVEATRLEEGNISYDVFEDRDNILRFTFIENWKSQDAISSHNASAHFLTFASALEGKADLEAFILKHKY